MTATATSKQNETANYIAYRMVTAALSQMSDSDKAAFAKANCAAMRRLNRSTETDEYAAVDAFYGDLLATFRKNAV